MNNYERIQNLSIDELAIEIRAIANWNRSEKKKAEQDEDFYLKYLKTEATSDKCRVMDTDYCKNECPLCRLGPEKE